MSTQKEMWDIPLFQLERHDRRKHGLREAVANMERQIPDFRRRLSVYKKVQRKEATLEQTKRAMREFEIEVGEKRRNQKLRISTLTESDRKIQSSSSVRDELDQELKMPIVSLANDL
jgi:hypothetical protein